MSFTLNNDSLVYSVAQTGNRQWFNGQSILSNPDMVVWSREFIAPADYSTTDFTVISDATGTNAVTANGLNGSLKVSCSATTNADAQSLQSKQACFQIVAGKNTWFETNIQLSDSTNSQLMVGLTAAFATNNTNFASVASGMWFEKDSAAQTIKAVATSGSVAQTALTGFSMADATYVVLSWKYNASTSAVEYYVNRQYCGSFTSGIPTGLAMAVVIYLKSGNNTGTKSATCDYLQFIAER